MGGFYKRRVQPDAPSVKISAETMKMLLALFMGVFVLGASATERNKRGLLGSWVNPPDSAQLAVMNGYPAEEHQVTTEDGYILTIFRIPYGRNGQPSVNRPPVIVQHGVLCDSDCWLISTPEKALAFVLADAGYDVWVGNNRGTTYGLKHVNLTTSDKEFWDFSFDEMGNYDLPAMIDHVLEKTGAKKVTYVAHSQGTTQFFVMGALRPEYNDKISVFSALAPVAFLNGTEGAIHIMSKFSSEFAWFMKLFHIYHLLGHNFATNAFTHFMCRPDAWFKNICDDVVQVITGFDTPQLNQTLMEIAVQYSPAGASLKQLVHFSQLCQNGGEFERFDYGKKQNLAVYKADIPPKYDLSRITVPVMLHYAENDYIARPNNVLEISQKLGSKTVKMIKVNNDQFNHIDFMWAKDVDTLLYNDVKANIKSYMNK